MLLLFVLTSSCNGQVKTDQAKDVKKQSQQSESDFTEHDPYFRGTKTIASSIGPRCIVRNVIQDKNGDFWLATWNGIIRYDGKSFTNLTNSEGLRRFRAFSILEDHSGNIWFGTIGAGIYLCDGKSFTNLTEEDGLVNNDVGCIYQDSKGNMWFGTRVGLSRYDGKTFTNYTKKEGMPDNDVNSIIEDQAGMLWIGARGEAFTYDGTTFTRITRDDGSPFINVRCILKDKNDNIWLGGNDGLWRFGNNSFTNIATNFFGYIYEDRDGNIWTSSESSDNRHAWVLSKFPAASLDSEKPTVNQILKKEGMFFGIVEDNEERIWVGTGDGVFRYDGYSFNYFGE